MTCALAHMLDLHWSARQLQACQTHAQAQVHVLAIHEIPGIESFQASPHCQGQNQTGSIHPIHAHIRPSIHMTTPQSCRRGQFPLKILPTPRGIDLARIGATHTSPACHAQQGGKRVRSCQCDIGVQNAHERLCGISQSPVVVGGKPCGHRVLDDLQHKRPSLRGCLRRRFRNVLRQNHPLYVCSAPACKLLKQALHARAMAVAHDGNCQFPAVSAACVFHRAAIVPRSLPCAELRNTHCHNRGP